METFRSLISQLVAFMLPAMAAVFLIDAKWRSVSDEDQATLVATFHITGYVCMFALMISHSTEARIWTRMVSYLTRTVCMAALGLFHQSAEVQK
uniref:Uncharacterized protein n=1 Tax=Arundo donax TaxID=35708 RepID=A0A0A9BSE1_ARUDO